MHSLQPGFLAGLAGFTGEQLKQIRALGDARGRQALWFQQIPETLRSLRNRAVIQSAESSNRMEGVVVGAGRLEPLILQQEDPRNRSEQEVAGYRDALKLIHEAARDMPTTPNVLLQLHGYLYRYQADRGGHWKSAPNDIIETRSDGTQRVRFRPSQPHLVDSQMRTLCDAYRLAVDQQHEPLLLIPLTVLDFLCIHPFRDGNGRIGRLLTLLLLYQHGYEVGRYISLERVIEQSKETYYETLEASSQGWHESAHNVMPWLNYFWGMLLRAHREFEERVNAARPAGYGGKSEQIRAAVLKRQQPFALAEIEAECVGVSRDLVRNVMRQMKSENLIKPTGTGRSAKWLRIIAPTAPRS